MVIKILTDSASDIDIEEAKNLGIDFVPMKVQFGQEEFLDGVNLSHKEFFEKLIENNEFPKTSQINEFQFNEKFEELTKDGSQLLVITISSKLSGTYNSAVQAAKKFKGKVFVLDSLNVCIGERILVQYAIRLVKENKLSITEIYDELNNKKDKIQLMAVLDTLKYLRKGGRISAFTAFAGNLLSIKPVISVIKGEIKLVGKAIGSKKSNNLLNQLVEKCGGIDFSMPYGLVYSGLSDEYLQKYLADSEQLYKGHVKDMKSIPSYMIGSAIGTHVGPNAVGVAFYALNQESANDKK